MVWRLFAATFAALALMCGTARAAITWQAEPAPSEELRIYHAAVAWNGDLVVLGGLSFNLVLALPDALCRQPLQSLLLVVAGGFWVLVTGVLLGQVRECW